MRVLVLNPGSSSLKGSLIETDGERTLAEGTISWADADAGRRPHDADVERLVDELDAHAPAAVGYRVVHGGGEFTAPTRLSDAIADRIEALDELAPLHNAAAARTIRAGLRLLPNAQHVACFDTAFHATLPAEAYRYLLPAEWVARFGLRRYGFHGLSVAWASERAAWLLSQPPDELGVVVAHLGSGCSVTAVQDGRSVDTSMGFTPLDGLVMATRPGAIDPGIPLHLLRQGVSVEELAQGLAHRSGLAASGVSADARELEAATATGNAAATLALAIFSRRAAAAIAAAATTLRRLDAVVFTGGIGENSEHLRSDICARLGAIGVPQPAAADGTEDQVLANEGVAVLRVRAREDLVIARAAARPA